MSLNTMAAQMEAKRRTRAEDAGHKAAVLLAAAAALGLGIVLAAYGWDYYLMDAARRPFSPKHALLRPGGTFGLRLGVLGLLLFFMIYLYPLRKRWPWLAARGKTTRWLDYHVVLGLAAPVVISFHASFKAQGLAGAAYWTMIALTASGVVGRYFYAQIPRSLEAARSQLRELESTVPRLVELVPEGLLPPDLAARITTLPAPEQVRTMSAAGALLAMGRLDLSRFLQIARIRRGAAGPSRTAGGLLPSGNPGLDKAILALRRQASLSKKMLFLARTQRIFYLWHVVHRPFSLSFAVLVILHLSVVFTLGFF
jgi:hypothetical protein